MPSSETNSVIAASAHQGAPQGSPVQSPTPQLALPAISRRAALALSAIVLALIALYMGFGQSPIERAGIVVALSIGLWATGWLPEWLTAMVFFTLCMLADIAPATTVFAGFSSSATWLVLSGVVIGGAIAHTGLGNGLASRIAPLIEASYAKTIVGVVALGAIMMFVMPSAMGRVVLLVPILMALADRLGYFEGTKGRTGIVLGGVLATFLPAFSVLPANVPNNVLVGSVETVFGSGPTYSEYLWLHFPVLGLLKTLLLIPLLLFFYHDANPAHREAPAEVKPIGGSAKHLAILLLGAVVLWASDGWHGISPAWIGMIVAVWCLYPGTGLLKAKPLQGMSFEPIFYVAGIVSMGAVAHQSGLGAEIATWVLSILPLSPDNSAQNFGLLSALSALVGMAVTLPGVPAILTPLTPDLSAATNWAPEAVYMAQVVGFSTVLLPYQAPPLVVAIQTGGLSMREVVRMCTVTAIISIVVLWPLDYLWWVTLGLVN